MICPKCGEEYQDMCECGYTGNKPVTPWRVAALMCLFVLWVLVLVFIDGCSRVTFQQRPSKWSSNYFINIDEIDPNDYICYDPNKIWQPDPPMVVPPYKRTYQGDIIVRDRKIIYRDKLGRESELD